MEVSYGSQGLNPSHSSGNPKSLGHQGTPAGTVFKRVFGEFLLWYNRIDIVSAAPGHRFSLRHSGLKDPIAIGHSCSSDLIPDLQTPYGSGPPKMIKKKKKVFAFLSGIDATCHTASLNLFFFPFISVTWSHPHVKWT